ncbi:hypothetical protein BACI_c24320 [Bacillus cereus biovar anthracis str. CI]|nr:hypothetical protein BACI_c24320 [Bacillus cereus biovar anthracis str. CI]
MPSSRELYSSSEIVELLQALSRIILDKKTTIRFFIGIPPQLSHLN